jgi:hypothetical protein
MGTGMNVEPHMAPWPEGKFYRVDQVDAVIRELEAERDAARADAELARNMMREGINLIAGDLVGAEWKIACHSFVKRAKAVDAAIDAARGGGA